MPTASAACAIIRSVVEGSVPTDAAAFGAAPIDLRFYGDNLSPLPDDPAPFAFALFEAERASVIERGGGSGRLRHRNPGRADFFVCTPKLTGMTRAADIAEQIAVLFRSFNDQGIVVDVVTVYPTVDGTGLMPPGSNSDAGNYMVAAVEVEFHFDLIG